MLLSGGVEERPVSVDIAASGSRFVFSNNMCFDAEKELAHHVMSMIYGIFLRRNMFLMRTLNCTFHSFLSQQILGMCSKFQQYPGDSPCLVDA